MDESTVDRTTNLIEQNKIVYVSEIDGTTDIFLFDPLERRSERITNSTDHESSPRMSPDGSQILFISRKDYSQNSSYEFIHSSDIFVVNTDGKDLRKIAGEHFEVMNPQWSPDGTKIMFVARKDYSHDSHYEFVHSSDIFVVDTDGKDLRKIAGENFDEDHPQWSPNGTQILYLTDLTPEDLHREINIINVDGTKHQVLADSVVPTYTPSWSPDGNKIIFTSWRSDNFHIICINSDGTEEIQLTKNPIGGSQAYWSPDGTKIAYKRGKLWEIGNPDMLDEGIYVMNPDGSNNHALFFPNFRIQELCWSPDGTQLAFLGGWDIYTINADGTGKRKILNTWSFFYVIRNINWSPSGKQITYQSMISLETIDSDWETYVVDSNGRKKRKLSK
jgi:TolB protein